MIYKYQKLNNYLRDKKMPPKADPTENNGNAYAYGHDKEKK